MKFLIMEYIFSLTQIIFAESVKQILLPSERTQLFYNKRIYNIITKNNILV